MFNRLRAFWPKDCQSGSPGKTHQNGDYLKQAMRKSNPATGFEPAVIQRLQAGSNPVAR